MRAMFLICKALAEKGNILLWIFLAVEFVFAVFIGCLSYRKCRLAERIIIIVLGVALTVAGDVMYNKPDIAGFIAPILPIMGIPIVVGAAAGWGVHHLIKGRKART